MNDLTLSSSQLQLLGKFDTPTVCNVIELFNVRPRNTGYMDQRIQACFPDLPPMVGYASTATFRSAGIQATNSYSTTEQQVMAFGQIPSPSIIVFQDLDNPTVAATFGEIMCTTYQRFGASGIITSGAGRDLEQVQALGFPAFTNGTICSHGYCHIPAIMVPVHVGGMTVYPGDLLHGDRNGVTNIPREIASEIGPACEVFMRAEAVVLDYLLGDEVTPKGFSECHSESRRMIEQLRKQVALKVSEKGKD